LDELRDFANRRNMGQKLVGGGVRGAATRGLLGMDAPENATPIQREVYENAARMSAPAQGLTALKAATVFHGSPHKFTKFDPKKIGTGEGNQSFGHGLYVAESKDVANKYREMLSPTYQTVGGKQVQSEGEKWAVMGLSKMSPLEAKAQIQRLAAAGYPSPKMAKQFEEEGLAAVDKFSGQNVSAGIEGNLYKIDLPDEAIARMLDWEKPLNKQPQVVRESLSKLGIAVDDRKLSEFDDALLGALAGTGSSSIPKQPMNQMGQEIYRSLGAPQVAAQRLREAGIPGIRYLDQGSRGQGQGTSNFVVFPGEEELLRILERNGVPIQSLLD
jgi:hypothetical protein